MQNSSIPVVREQLLAKLNDLDSLQPMPTYALSLVNACQNPLTATQDLISIVEAEPAIAARVLAVANSPLYGYSRQIGSISHAIVILGIGNLSRLAVSFAAKNMYCGGDAAKEFCQNLYRHSLGCAMVARMLASKSTSSCDPEQAFLGGLLHDIGKIALIQLVPEEYEQLSQIKCPDERLSNELELFGVCHQEIGEICADNWGFPSDITNVISQHHGTATAPLDSGLAQIVEAANYLALGEGVGCDPCELNPENCSRNPLLAQLTPETRQDVVDSARLEFDALANAG